MSASSEQPCVFIDVEAGEGNGLTQDMKNWTFSNKEQGLAHVKAAFHNQVGPPLRSPFCELLGWSVEIYCSTRGNDFTPTGVYGKRVDGMNGAGIYLGCDVQGGMTRFFNLDGRIFVTGCRNMDGKPLVSDSLWGILNFICDAMDWYGDDEDPVPKIQRQAKKYREGIWQPAGGDGGVDVYCVDVNRSTDPTNPVSSFK